MGQIIGIHSNNMSNIYQNEAAENRKGLADGETVITTKVRSTISKGSALPERPSAGFSRRRSGVRILIESVQRHTKLIRVTDRPGAQH